MNQTETSAVSMLMEVVAGRAAEARSRFESLGVLDWSLEQSEKDCRAALSAFDHFLKLSGLPSWDSPPPDLIEYWRDLWLADLFIPVAKYVIAVPLASHSGVRTSSGVEFRELPPRPDWLPESLPALRALFPTHSSIPYLKPLRTRLSETTRAGVPTRRALALCWSFQAIKNMMPSMWVTQVGKSLSDHARLLSVSPPPLTDLARDVLRCVGNSVAQACYRPGTSYYSLPRAKLSSSAGWVKMFDQEAKRFRTMEGTRAAQRAALGGTGTEELLSMTYHPQVGVKSFRGHPYQFRWDDWDFDPKVSVVALQEPFKIRTISIADGPATAAGTSLQRVWHSFLRQLRPFHLIGGKRVAPTVESMFDWSPGKYFVSGDYSAATDRLSLEASRVVYEALIAPLALPAELERRLRTGLFHSEMDYSRTLETFRGRVPDALLDSVPVPPMTRQTNGQLMGNVLSFPILCLVNLSAWIISMLNGPFDRLRHTLWGGLMRGYWLPDELDQLPVLINGDDILFQATPEEYANWRESIRQFGLELSVGKNFYSDTFFTVNSELYTSSGFVSRPWWGGLLTDLVRMRNELKWELGTDVLTGDLRKVLPDVQSLFLSSVPPARRVEANDLFLSVYAPLLESYKGLNWFIPVELGGMGLKPGSKSYTITYAQRKLAVRLSFGQEAPAGFSPQGTLVSARNDATLRELVRPLRLRGEVVMDESGGRYVLDRSKPLAVRAGGVYYRAHPLVDTLLQSTSLFSRWLDYHVDGIRIDPDRVRGSVSRLLSWGCKLSDKHLDRFAEVDLTPSYSCATRVELLKV